MKKIISSIPNGGAPWSDDTLGGILNGEVWTALEAMLQSISNPLASGNVGVIVSGCVCTLNGAGPNYNCTSGIVYMSGQFMYFPGFSNQALPQYIYPASLITTQKPFYDGISRNLITEQDASYQSSAPGSGQYIALTTTGLMGAPGGFTFNYAPAWNTVTLQNGWANYNGTCRWRMKNPSTFQLAGKLSSTGATATQFASIPVQGYSLGGTPAFIRDFAIYNAGSSTVQQMRVTTSGSNLIFTTTVAGQPDVSCEFSLDSLN